VRRIHPFSQSRWSRCQSHGRADCSPACRRWAKLLSQDSLDRSPEVGLISCSTAALQALVASPLWSGAGSLCLWAGFYIRDPSSCNDHKGRAAPCAARHRIVSTWSAACPSVREAGIGNRDGIVYLLLTALDACFPSWGGHGVRIGLAGTHPRSLISQRYNVSLSRSAKTGMREV
jgi:hypothetical protein